MKVLVFKDFLLLKESASTSSTSSFAVPHIGWNSLVFNPQCTDALSFIHNDKISSIESKDFYFVHSFVARTSSNYHQMFYFEHPDFRQTAGVCKGNVVGFNFILRKVAHLVMLF